jgi:hypothetical protein
MERTVRRVVRQARGPKTVDDLMADRAALIEQLSSPLAVETPQLGKVEFRSVAEIQTAIGLIDGQIAATAGTPRVIVAQSNRGTGRGDCCS